MKKLKLLLSVSVMCLSLAVLCFGVLAATNVTYSISGTISYTVSDAFVKVNINVYKGTNQYTTSDALKTLAENLESSTIATKLADNGFTADSVTIDEYDSTKANSFTKTDLNLTLTSENPSYLVEMTIQNLSPSVNVWAKATWELTGDNVVEYDNKSQPTISSEAAQKIYFIVSIEDMTQSISSATYTMGLEIGINIMPIISNVNGDEIYSTYGTTWEEFSQEDGNSVIYTFSSNGYLLKNDEIMCYNNEKVSKTDAIIDRAEYLKQKLTKDFQVTLQDGETYWYIELGTYNSSPIKWRLVSLDGETRYDYTSTQPTKHEGQSLFKKHTQQHVCSVRITPTAQAQSEVI